MENAPQPSDVQLGLRDHRITCSSRDQALIWAMECSDLAVIGEYTIANWPGLDDYVLVFVSWSGEWRDVPQGADGVSDTIAALQAAVGGSLTAMLANSASWATVVIWPDTLKGRQLFKLQEEPRTGWLRMVYPKLRRCALDDWLVAYVRGGQRPAQ